MPIPGASWVLPAIVAAVASGTLLAGPAGGASLAERPGYTIAASQMPRDVPAARAALRRSWERAAPGTLTRSDIAYVLRLGARHLRAAEPEGRRRTVARTLRVNAWWYSRGQSPRERAIVRDPGGVLSTYWEGRGFAINPVATAGRWQDLNGDLAPEALAAALLPLGVERRGAGTRFLLWEYYDVPDRPGAIRPGASGMAQGRVAQLMARAYHRTGEARFADASRRALAAFRVPVRRGGVLSLVSAAGLPSRPWYVERAFPGASPWKGAALNGFMVSLLNLAATAPLLASRPAPLTNGPRALRARPRAAGSVGAAALADRLARAGEVTLKRYLPLHDTGTWSLYGLLTPGLPWRSDVADEVYHCYHVRLLRQLHAQAPRHRFDAVARRWEGYARAAGVGCASAR